MQLQALWFLLLMGAGTAASTAEEPAVVFARGDYAGVVTALEPAYRSGSAPL